MARTRMTARRSTDPNEGIRRQRYEALSLRDLRTLATAYGITEAKNSKKSIINSLLSRRELAVEPHILHVMNRPEDVQDVAYHHIGMYLTPLPNRDLYTYFMNNIRAYDTAMRRREIPNTINYDTIESFTDYELFDLTGAFFPPRSRHELIATILTLQEQPDFFLPLRRVCLDWMPSEYELILAFGTPDRYTCLQIEDVNPNDYPPEQVRNLLELVEFLIEYYEQEGREDLVGALEALVGKTV